ncbi:unnamed protein product, partial [Rhizoctonia solani]
MDVSTPLTFGGKRAFARRKYVEASFAPSKALAQASKLFSKKSRECPCLMIFDRGWQHEECRVMKWYELQKASSTKFRSIQHRRDIGHPYYHEFLLIQLINGAFCRVERTGEGSRVDAIRNIGCAANDYIQYFPSITAYETFIRDSKPSKLIAEIRFPCNLDIMDVLAVCYAVYIQPRTRTYTLQRFNCYFLCTIILLALTRRFTRWEATVTSDTWKEAVNYALDRVGEVSRDPNSTQLVFRVCRYLEPGCAEPSEFILKALRDELGAEPGTYSSVKQALAGNLWRSAWPRCKNRAMVRNINKAISIAIGGDSGCARAFNSAIHDGKTVLQQKHATFAMVNKIHNKKATAAMADGVNALAKGSAEQYRLEKIERPSSMFRDAWVSVVSSAVGFWFPIQLLCAGDMETWGFKRMFLSSPRGIYAGQRVAKLQSRRLYGMSAPNGYTVEVAGNMRIDSTATMPEDMAQANCDMAARSLDETLKALSNQGDLTIPNITIALYATLCKNVWDDWLNRSFRQLLAEFLPDMLLDEEEGVLVEIPTG